MKRHMKQFIIRGALFAWGGPLVLSIIYFCLQASGEMTALSPNSAAFGIISTTILAFIAAGITIVYQIESLPAPLAALIHLAVLYLAYLVCYLLNGWILSKNLGWFTLIFVAIFAVIWLFIYFANRHNVKRLNQNFHK